MVKARRIAIIRREGPVDKVDKELVVSGDDIWSKADQILAEMSYSAPEVGYDKCDFRVEYEDGSVYEGRFDLKARTHGLPCLGAHIRRFCEFFAGLRKPPHLSKEGYEMVVNEGNKEWFKKLLATYEVGPSICNCQEG